MEAVLFDFGGTLDANGIAWKERLHSICLAFNINPDNEKFDRAFYDADDYLSRHHNLEKLSFEETVFVQVSDFFKNLKLGDKKLETEIAKRFVDDSREWIKKSKRVLDELNPKFKLAIVSNFYGNLKSVVTSEGLADYFGVLTDSSVVGTVKPDEKIFFHALNTLNVKPENALMVGDSVKRDMKGAENLNMPHALLWGDRGKFEKPQICCDKAIILNDLSELPKKIEEFVLTKK
jgi:putative hydrolase of the HAD superfamily